MKAGVKKGTRFIVLDKQRKCIVCSKSFICRGNAKYCWEHKKI